jgi:hypothetical protein
MTGDPPSRPAERFDEVFDAYFAEIHRYAAKRLGPDAAADVAAPTFLEAFRQRQRYDPERANVRTWLYGIATKVVGRHQRAETRLLRARARLGPGRGAEEHTEQVDSRKPLAKISAAAAFLRSPVPPKARAGMIRALADQQGISAIGPATDPLGRPGVAMASDEEAVTATGEYGGPKADRGTYRARQVIIFDERTGALLSSQEELTKPGGPYSEMKPGFVINYSACRSAKWTDAKPTPPPGLPFG